MKTIGRPPKPENQKRHALTVTVSFEAFTGIREYAAANSLELSATVDRAILAFLQGQSAPAVADLTPASSMVPVLPAVFEPIKKPRKPKPPIKGLSAKTYAKVIEGLADWQNTRGVPIVPNYLAEMVGVTTSGVSKYIKQACQDKILKKIQNGVYRIIPENFPTSDHTSSPTPASPLPR